MLFKTYQKLLGASCLALYLVGCGSGGESPVEIEKNDFNSTLKIISKADNIEIKDLKLNRRNCEHDKNLLKKLIQEYKAIKKHQTDLEELTQYVQQFNNPNELLKTLTDIAIRVESKGFDKVPRKFGLLYDCYVSSIMPINYEPLYGIADSSSNAINIMNLKSDLHNIRDAIENTKNPKDYHYINLKELSKLIHSIFPEYGGVGVFEIAGDFIDGDNISKKGLQRLARLESMWPSIEKFYLTFLKETILRHAKKVTDKLIGSEAEAIQNINKLEQLIKDLENKKSTMAVDLKFGESFTTQYRCQNLIEVGVKTDKGNWTFNFNR